jgi:hypothetical protein
MVGVPAIPLWMFVRKKPNKSGVVSVQVISKVGGKYQVVKTIRSSKDEQEIGALATEAEQYISSLTKQSAINFEIEKERAVIDLFFNGIQSVRLILLCQVTHFC